MTHTLSSIKQAERLTVNDAPSLAQLETACFGLPWTEQAFRDAFDRTTFSAFGIKDTGCGNSLMGYIVVYHTMDELEILNIAVREDKRQQGYGHALMTAVLQDAQERGILRAVLEVRAGNVPALRLYESFGFVQAGKRRGYYQDNGEDALIYALESIVI